MWRWLFEPTTTPLFWARLVLHVVGEVASLFWERHFDIEPVRPDLVAGLPRRADRLGDFELSPEKLCVRLQ